jgi:hypothetical protein
MAKRFPIVLAFFYPLLADKQKHELVLGAYVTTDSPPLRRCVSCLGARSLAAKPPPTLQQIQVASLSVHKPLSMAGAPITHLAAYEGGVIA